MAVTHGHQASVAKRRKSMPRRYPISSGGSPIGVRQPPIFETTKMKKTM